MSLEATETLLCFQIKQTNVVMQKKASAYENISSIIF